jgi:hypothetical protein
MRSSANEADDDRSERSILAFVERRERNQPSPILHDDEIYASDDAGAGRSAMARGKDKRRDDDDGDRATDRMGGRMARKPQAAMDPSPLRPVVRQAMDGARVEMDAGELSFGGDQNCRELAGKRGHRSGTVGAAPAVLMVIQFDELQRPSSPCCFA